MLPYVAPSARGQRLFSSEALTRVFNETVAPEIDKEHSLVVAGAVNEAGVQAAIVYSKQFTLGRPTPHGGAVQGEWRVEAAVTYNWQGEQDAGAKVLIKI